MFDRDADRSIRSACVDGEGRGRRRRRFLEATAGAAAVSISGCLGTYDAIATTTDDSGDDAITVGLLAPSPDRDFVGRSMERSARVAVADCNDDGGIAGRDVELVVGDTGGDPLEARRAYHRLVLDEGVDVTVGVFDSPTLVALLPDIAEQETVHLTTGAATTAASRRVAEEYDRYKYHFRVGPTNDRDLGRAQVDFLADVGPDVGWESIALLAEDYDWTEGPWAVYQDRLDETGVDVVMEERYPPAIDDFSDLYDEAEAAGADAAVIAAAHTGTDALVDWVAPSRRPFAFGGIHVPMQLPTYYDRTDGACRYGIGQISATPDSEFTGTGEFVSAYRDAYDGAEPVYVGYHTYDAIRLLGAVADDPALFDGDGLVSALEDVSYDGTIGTVEFYDRDHEHPHDLRYVEGETLFFQWQERAGEGVQEVIWPDEHATADYVEPQ